MPSRPGRRTTIRELAEYTGLSPAAVSYALRGLQVSAETERRVREAAEKLGYEADPIARALAGGSTGVVGLLVGSLADFWIQEAAEPEQPGKSGGPVRMIVTVADPDPLFARALAAGAVEVSGMSEDHGWRIGRLADPFGLHWEIGKQLSDPDA